MSELANAGTKDNSGKKTNRLLLAVFGILILLFLIVLSQTIGIVLSPDEIMPPAPTTSTSTLAVTSSIQVSTTATSTSTITTTSTVQQELLRFVIVRYDNSSEFYPVYTDTKALAIYIKNEGSARDIRVSAYLPNGSQLGISPASATIASDETKRFQIKIGVWQLEDTQNVSLTIKSGDQTVKKELPVKKINRRAIIIERTVA